MANAGPETHRGTENADAEPWSDNMCKPGDTKSLVPGKVVTPVVLVAFTS